MAREKDIVGENRTFRSQGPKSTLRDAASSLGGGAAARSRAAQKGEEGRRRVRGPGRRRVAAHRGFHERVRARGRDRHAKTKRPRRAAERAARLRRTRASRKRRATRAAWATPASRRASRPGALADEGGYGSGQATKQREPTHPPNGANEDHPSRAQQTRRGSRASFPDVADEEQRGRQDHGRPV